MTGRVLWVMGAIVLAGCAVRSRVMLADSPADVRKWADVTAREWGFAQPRQEDGRVVYQSAQLAGPSREQLQLRLEPIERGEVRVKVKFTGPTAGSEGFFLKDLQRNISAGTILPVGK